MQRAKPFLKGYDSIYGSEMVIRIRAAAPEDAATIHGFIKALALYEKEPHAVEVTVETLQSQMSATAPPFECLLAEDEELGTIGFALFFMSYSTWRGQPGIYLEDLYVSPDARGRGAARALIKRLRAVGKERGCRRLEWSVLDWNELAIGFYEHLGAKPMSGWTTWRLPID